MSSHTVSAPAGKESLRRRVQSTLTSLATGTRAESAVAIGAVGVVALHVADDNFIQPNAGTSAADHLISGLVPLALLAGAVVVYPRARAGLGGVIALLGGFFGVLGGIEALYYGRTVGLSGDDYTGIVSLVAGIALFGVGIVTLWRSRRRNDRLWWRYTRRLVLAATASVAAFVLLGPVALSYVVTHAARAHVPAADFGAPYENVEFTTSDGLRLKGWYIRSQNGAAVISFPGRARGLCGLVLQAVGVTLPLQALQSSEVVGEAVGLVRPARLDDLRSQLPPPSPRIRHAGRAPDGC